MIKAKDLFGLSISDTLAVLQRLEAEGDPDARLIRQAIEREAQTVSQRPVVLQLRKVAEELAAGKFLFSGRIEGIVLDLASLMAVPRSGKRSRFNFWLKDPALQVLSGIHVTPDAVKFEHYAVKDRNEFKGFRDAQVYGLSLSDWLGDLEPGTDGLGTEQPEGVFAVDDYGVLLRFFTPSRFRIYSQPASSELEVCLYAEALEGAAVAKRRLGPRRAVWSETELVVRLTAEDAMELTALSQKGGVLRVWDIFFPFGADFMDSGFRRGWRQASSGIPAGRGSLSSHQVRMPWTLFPKVARVLPTLSSKEKEIVMGLLALQKSGGVAA